VDITGAQRPTMGKLQGSDLSILPKMNDFKGIPAYF